MLLLGFSFPFVLGFAFLIAKLWIDVSRPSPCAFGTILPKLCVVSSDEIQRYNKIEGKGSGIVRHLRREVRAKQIGVNWGYIRQMAWNTRLFQQATRFEKMKIDPAKSAFDFEPREHLILELVNESADTRRELYKCQITVLVRTILRLDIPQRIFIKLLGQYKHLEQEMLILASMSEDGSYYQMLVDRLGLNDWGLIQGGTSTPA